MWGLDTKKSSAQPRRDSKKLQMLGPIWSKNISAHPCIFEDYSTVILALVTLI